MGITRCAPLHATGTTNVRQIVRAGSGGYMSTALEPGMRAVALPVTAELAARLKPGQVRVHLEDGTGGAGYSFSDDVMSTS